MDKLVRIRKGVIPFQVPFASAKIEALKKDKGIKEFVRSVKGAIYFLPNSVKQISEHELLYIQEYEKDDFKKLSVVKDIKTKSEKAEAQAKKPTERDTNKPAEESNKPANKGEGEDKGKGKK